MVVGRQNTDSYFISDIYYNVNNDGSLFVLTFSWLFRYLPWLHENGSWVAGPVEEEDALRRPPPLLLASIRSWTQEEEEDQRHQWGVLLPQVCHLWLQCYILGKKKKIPIPISNNEWFFKYHFSFLVWESWLLESGPGLRKIPSITCPNLQTLL